MANYSQNLNAELFKCDLPVCHYLIALRIRPSTQRYGLCLSRNCANTHLSV